jgi:hypothetical protein
MTEEYYVYAYLRENGTPYYIGKGRGYRAYYRTKYELIVLPPDDKILIILQNLTEEQAFSNERNYIAWYGRLDINTGTLENRTDGGEGISGYKHTKEVKDKLRQHSTGRYYSEETRKKISDNTKGKKRTEEQKKRISEAKKGIGIGQVPWNKGKTYSWSEGYFAWNKGKKRPPFSEEHKKRIADARRGKVPSEETRRKMSEAHKGRVPWNKGKSGYESKKWSKKVPKDKKEKGANRNSKSGIKGVCFNKLSGKWRAYIMHNTQSIHLGTFVNIEDAIAARIAGENKCNKVQKSGSNLNR